jgi:transporter family-2 protein
VNNLYILLAVAAGAGVASQAVINARLRFILGAPVWAATAQFVVGFLMLILFAVLSRQAVPAAADVARAPWWMWTGGLFGALFILMAVVVTPVLGAALMLSASIVGQLGAALVIDHFGLFGGTVIRVSPTRVLGVVLLGLGVVLIRWKS